MGEKFKQGPSSADLKESLVIGIAEAPKGFDPHAEAFGVAMAKSLKSRRDQSPGITIRAAERRDMGNGTTCVRYTLGASHHVWVSIHPEGPGTASAVVCKPSRSLVAPSKDFRLAQTPEEAAGFIWASAVQVCK